MENKNFKVGQTWKARRGSTHFITEIDLSDPMPVKSTADNHTACWNFNGRYWNNYFESGLDLISLVE